MVNKVRRRERSLARRFRQLNREERERLIHALRNPREATQEDLNLVLDVVLTPKQRKQLVEEFEHIHQEASAPLLKCFGILSDELADEMLSAIEEAFEPCVR